MSFRSKKKRTRNDDGHDDDDDDALEGAGAEDDHRKERDTMDEGEDEKDYRVKFPYRLHRFITLMSQKHPDIARWEGDGFFTCPSHDPDKLRKLVQQKMNSTCDIIYCILMCDDTALWDDTTR